MVFATHSTHKLLAGISRASQIIVQESETRKLDRNVFNEAYLMHVHVAAVRDHRVLRRGRHDGAARRHRAGRGSIREAMDFRRAMRKVESEFGKNDWWFRSGAEPPCAEGIGNRDEWILESNDHWHGFGDLAEGFNMLDPIKATIITPGLDMSGSFGETGIPAALVSST